MMDMKTFFSQMLTPGTAPCTLFGMTLGVAFAVLCLTIGLMLLFELLAVEVSTVLFILAGGVCGIVAYGLLGAREAKK